MNEPGETSPDPSVLMKAVRVQVTQLTRALAVYRRVMLGMVIICAMLIAAGVVLGITVVQVRGTVATEHADEVASCVAGNTYRAADKELWTAFVDLLIQGAGAHPNPTSLAEAKAYLQLVDKTDASRPC